MGRGRHLLDCGVGGMLVGREGGREVAEGDGK